MDVVAPFSRSCILNLLSWKYENFQGKVVAVPVKSKQSSKAPMSISKKKEDSSDSSESDSEDEVMTHLLLIHLFEEIVMSTVLC